MDDQIQPALEIVEHRHFAAFHQQDIGRTQLIGLAPTAQSRLDVFDALETEPADQAAGETGQPRETRNLLRGAQTLDFGQRIGDFARFDQVAQLGHVQRMPGERVHAMRRQTDDGIAAEALATLHRLEQIRVRAVGELEIDRQWRIEVGQHLAHHRNQGMAVVGVLLELFERDHAEILDESATGMRAASAAPSPIRVLCGRCSRAMMEGGLVHVCAILAASALSRIPGPSVAVIVPSPKLRRIEGHRRDDGRKRDCFHYTGRAVPRGAALLLACLHQRRPFFMSDRHIDGVASASHPTFVIPTPATAGGGTCFLQSTLIEQQVPRCARDDTGYQRTAATAAFICATTAA